MPLALLNLSFSSPQEVRFSPPMIPFSPPRCEGSAWVRALWHLVFGSARPVLDVPGAHAAPGHALSLRAVRFDADSARRRPTLDARADADPDHDVNAWTDDEDADADRSMAELSLSYLELPGADATEALDRLSLSGGPRPSSEPLDALDRLC